MRLFLVLVPVLGAAAMAADVAQRYGSFPIIADGLSPRYFLDRSLPLAKRDGNCGDDRHPCLDIGYGGDCCDNDNYCYVDKENKPKCCPIGSNCEDESNCDSKAYFCSQTKTKDGTATPVPACCNRKCPQTSHYVCPQSLGGNCCPFGSDCQEGGNCINTKEASKTAMLTPVIEGCTTSQYKCQDGNGCCDNNYRCTQVSDTAYCAPGAPTGSDVTLLDEDDLNGGGLSDGAKAGIAVGVVVGAGLIIGLITWLCISKRRRRRQAVTQQSASAGDAPVEDANMTEVTASSRLARSRGLTQDYFGPAAVPGPYTETVASSPGQRNAVPSQPQAPGDIIAPVEIDSKDGPLTPHSPAVVYQTPVDETISGRFELYGTELSPQSPSPLQASPLPPSPSVLSSPASPRSEAVRPDRS